MQKTEVGPVFVYHPSFLVMGTIRKQADSQRLEQRSVEEETLCD